MKKILLSFLFFLSSFILLAQEEMEKMEDGKWSEDTKTWIFGVFAVFILILTARTFRNKPSA